jgi:hypothetical protein
MQITPKYLRCREKERGFMEVLSRTGLFCCVFRIQTEPAFIHFNEEECGTGIANEKEGGNG